MAAPADVQTFVTAAKAFATAASNAAAGGLLDPSLLAQLNALPPLCDAAIKALRAASTDPGVGDAVTACELLMAKCSRLGDAIIASQPLVENYTVPQDTPLMVILEQFYGSDAFAKQPEVEANNPDLLGLILIPAGTTIRLAAATV